MSGEPANFSLDDAARWRATRRQAKHGAKHNEAPRPTLSFLRRSTCWIWVDCDMCGHRAPLAFAPLIIRWGPDASSDKLRQCARCSACGRKGATLRHPSWCDTQTGFMPFPVPARMSGDR
jgi:hypothetical protein